MGQITRKPKYDKFWDWLNNSIDAKADQDENMVDAIEMLLRFLPDNELDMVIAEIEENAMIRLGAYGIEIDLNKQGEAVAIRSELKSDCPHCSQPNCFFDCDESQHDSQARAKNRAYDGIESLLLALAGADVDVNTPAFLKAIETAVESVENNIG